MKGFLLGLLIAGLGFGTYLEAFMLSGLLCIVAALMVLFIGAGRHHREPAAPPLPAG